MNDEQFWALIDAARAVNGDPADPATPSAHPQALTATLRPLSDEDLAAFGAHFYRLLIQLNRWDLWGAGYVIAGGMSDDAFHYFRSWIVGKGRAVFDLALTDPEELGAYVGPLDTDVENESLEYAAIELLEERDLDDPRDAVDGDGDGDPEGEMFDEDGVYDVYPKLAAQFS